MLQLHLPETLANGTVRLSWDTVLGRAYRLEVSTDFKTWQAVTDLAPASTTSLSTTLPALDPHLPYFFRVLVSP